MMNMMSWGSNGKQHDAIITMNSTTTRQQPETPGLMKQNDITIYYTTGGSYV
jgi:hypothetical protein